MNSRPIELSIGQINGHSCIDTLIRNMNTNDRGQVYDSLKDYMHYSLTLSGTKDYNPAVVDYIMNKTNISVSDEGKISDIVSLFISTTRAILELSKLHVRRACGFSIQSFRISHIDDYRRDTLSVVVVYD